MSDNVPLRTSQHGQDPEFEPVQMYRFFMSMDSVRREIDGHRTKFDDILLTVMMV